MNVIHRYNLPILGLHTIHAPVGARAVSAVPRLSQPGWTVYLLHGDDTEGPKEPLHFVSIKTGVPFPATGIVYLATIPGAGVHLFAMTEKSRLEWLELYPSIDESLAD